MRAVYVSLDPGVPVFGNKGSSVHVQAVLRSLVARGADVTLVTTRPGGAPPPDLAGVTVRHVTVPATAGPADRERALQALDATLPAALDRLLSEGPVDLVYERYSLWSRSTMAWARTRGVLSALEVNAPLVDEQATHRVLVDRATAEEVARSAFSAAGTVVCVSDAVRRWTSDHGAPAQRTFTVSNGVDTALVRPRPGGPPTGPFTVGFTGTLKPWHGVDSLLRAVHRLRARGRDCRLLLVGDGPERARTEDAVRTLGLEDATEMTGAVAPHEVPPLLGRMHVGTAPYPAMASFYFSPLKVYEYLAAGVPVVASRVDGMPRALVQGEAGVLVEPGDVEQLAAALASLMDDPVRRQRLGRRAREVAVQEHDWNAVVDRILELSGCADVTV